MYTIYMYMESARTSNSNRHSLYGGFYNSDVKALPSQWRKPTATAPLTVLSARPEDAGLP